MMEATIQNVAKAASGTNGLTERDLQVVTMVAQGMERRPIATRLGVSLSVVNRHITVAMRETDTLNAPHLVAVLMARGVITAADITPGAAPTRATKEIRDRADRVVASRLITEPDTFEDERVNRVLLAVARDLGEQL